MTVLQDVIDGKYPKDDLGRSIVKTRDNQFVTIYATDHHHEWPLVGRIGDGADVDTWQADGSYLVPDGRSDSRLDLMSANAP